MKRIHGKSHNLKNKNVLYNRYNAMKNSCYNPKNITYKNNGARGIIVCDLWKNNFLEFFNWSITHGFTKKRALHRIDRDKNFSPENCKWLSKSNKSKLVIRNRKPCNKINVEYNGKTYSIKELSSLLKIPYITLYFRLRMLKIDDKSIKYVNS